MCYLEPGNIQVALYDDRLEITSPGMLLNNGLPKPELIDFDGDFRVNMYRKRDTNTKTGDQTCQPVNDGVNDGVNDEVNDQEK